MFIETPIGKNKTAKEFFQTPIQKNKTAFRCSAIVILFSDCEKILLLSGKTFSNKIN